MAAASAVLDSGRCSLVMEHTSKQDHCNHLNVSVDVAIDVPSRSTQTPSRPVPSRNILSSREITNWRFHMRSGQFDSQRYILIEMIISVILITACIIVLALSRNEKPHSLITVWIIGYASGCLATLPHLYLRYRRRFLKFVELFEFATRCFFFFWVPFGFQQMDGHLSSSDAPNQHRLCSAIVLTTLISYVSFSIAFWCHEPCIKFFSYLFGHSEDQTQTRGASLEIVGSLPKYKFKAKKPIEGNGSKYDYDPSKTSGEDGIITVGTGKEKSVSAEDEMCCICLRKYKDDEHLRELPCTHNFHVKCVDKWLKMNASCPLCKHEIGGPSEAASESVGDRRQSGNR